MAEVEKVLVTQIRGVAGRDKRTRATLQALGLGRVGKTREHTLNPALRGMMLKVRHLLKVVEAPGS